jgi:hypothetical protein
MKNLNLLVWMTQLGFSVAFPPLCFILLASWLRNRWGWGSWVIWTAIALGIVCAIDGLRVCLNAMDKMSKDKEKKEAPVSFNEHD